MKQLKNMSSLCSPWAIKKLGLDRNQKGYVLCTPRLIALCIIFSAVIILRGISRIARRCRVRYHENKYQSIPI